MLRRLRKHFRRHREYPEKLSGSGVCLKHNTFCGQDTAVVYENIMRDAKDVAFDQQNLRAEILARLRCLDMPAICQRLKKLSLTFRQGNLPFEYIRLAYIDLTISGVLFLRETEYSLAAFLERIFDPIEFMSDQRSLKKMRGKPGRVFPKDRGFFMHR